MAQPDIIRDILSKLTGLDQLKRLFWSELNYERVNEPLSTRDWNQELLESIHGAPLLFAAGGSDAEFQIIYVQMTARGLLRTQERPIVERLLKDHPLALFIFSNQQQDQWHFVNVKYAPERKTRRLFRRITVGRTERLRTAAERLALLDLSEMARDLFGIPPLAIQNRHDEAFDVEAVTRDFFRTYRTVFEAAEVEIQGLEGEPLRLFTQKLFNRLMFIVFLERKGWLNFNGDGREYLQDLWLAHLEERAGDNPDANFYTDRLYALFFAGLNNDQKIRIADMPGSSGFMNTRIGSVPYLNGGLFEQDYAEEAIYRDKQVFIPDSVFRRAINDLFYRFNFTVTESTPFDIEVAVDPEMLGKIFEELVTGRHESGSYYTPKPIVSFMCREALKGYLQTATHEAPVAIAAFVDEHDPGRIREHETVLDALKGVKSCDPACGSGAYLLGMLHELLDLRRTLFNIKQLDYDTTYGRKLDIIQNNLYGVDLDPFAVNIAQLRLWLSLVVEYEGENPPPLPNLDFKIEAGNSLTAPDPTGGLEVDMFRRQQVEEYFRLKSAYLDSHGQAKKGLRDQIDAQRAAIRDWARGKHTTEGFDWALEFAEVFAMDAQGRAGGFDIIVANPPYVRHELIKDEKPTLKRIYGTLYSGTADLYVYFYYRAHQLLKAGGYASFITSNKWMRAGYGKKLREHFGKNATIHSIVDFGDLPVFTATAYPCIMVWSRTPPREGNELLALVVNDLAAVDHILEETQSVAWKQGQASFSPHKWALVKSDLLELMNRIRSAGSELQQYTNATTYRGVTTGLNEAFVIDEETRLQLIAQDKASSEIIKPWLRGRDIGRWKVEWSGLYIIFTRRGIAIKKYPAIHSYLQQHRAKLTPGTEGGRKPGDYWWYEIQDNTAYYMEFEKPKLIWAKYGIQPAFAYDIEGYYLGNTGFILPTIDLSLVGILNSKVIQWYATKTFNLVRGGYVEWIPANVNKLPIPKFGDELRSQIANVVEDLINGAVSNSQARNNDLETELDRLVFEAYGLNSKEISLIEQQLGAQEVTKAATALKKLKAQE